MHTGKLVTDEQSECAERIGPNNLRAKIRLR